MHDKVDAELCMIPSMLETMNRKRKGKKIPDPATSIYQTIGIKF